MVSKGVLLTCHGLVWAAALALALWAGEARAAARYDTATPYTPPYNRKYIPLHGNDESYDPYQSDSPAEEADTGPRVPPSQYIMSALRTVLDVVRNINKQRSLKKSLPPANNSTALISKRTKLVNGTSVGEGRGFEDYYDEHHEHHEHETTTMKPIKQGRYTDPWAGYYDWIINEGSFKFWSVFQLFTAALLLYACLSAIYYAKFNPILPDYSMEYDDYFLERTVGRKARSLDVSELASGLTWMNPTTFQFILDAISNHYKEE
ncbi:hypothetical protein O3G_MSEX007989 [Manduca sexta]|uniref:Uncharacterized protein n=1 Tax=Manduca sexta TaxID=7130 RepID=A0A922CNT3_MANSE|nr:hypothetical protein O3G_MSEX007989 [Manduca sexta]